MKNSLKNIALGTALVAAAGGVGCSGDEDPVLPGGVDTLIILQRPARMDTGDIFQYTSYKPTTDSGKHARLLKLSPPTADGVQTTICCDNVPGYENADISGYDISFDAKQIVFSAKLAANQAYGLHILSLESGEVRALGTDPGRDYTSPIFLPGDKVMFTSNAVVEEGAPQHRDEYERGTTLQVGRIDVAGGNEELGARNLSHRTFPTLMSDGHVMMTQWDHLGPMNAGHLVFMQQDMTQMREAFGKEGTGASNSTLKAREISPGRFLAIATSRSRTIQSGALIDVRLGTVATDSDGNVSANEDKSEANATYKDLTPDVPHDGTPSAETVGRYYDAHALNAKDKPDILVSWADGPVESSVLGSAGLAANFGVYLYDTERQTRRPILDDPEMWDLFARPLQTRNAPPIVASSLDANLAGVGQTQIGSMNVYQSSLRTFDAGSIYGVRVSEGFSSEEGFPEMFGSTMFEGMATLGVAPVRADGSWAANVPANVPLRVQNIDVYGMSIFSEPVWFSGRPGENRFCGGCHEDRTEATTISPGLTDAIAQGATQFNKTPAVRDDRMSLNFSRDQIVGVAWDRALQPMFDAKCVSCHDGDANKPGNPTYTLTDGTVTLSWTFDLRGDTLPAEWAELGGDSHFTRSYLSVAGPDMEALEEGGFMILSGTVKQYLLPEDARGSEMVRLLNPTRQFPAQTSERAFNTTPHMQGRGTDLTPDEFYAVILSADNGVSFFSRENNPGLNEY